MCDFSTDLQLPGWGPYGKEYVGLSHVADREAGHRWDCFVMPGYHRRAVVGPYGLRENRWHCWKTAADLSSYTLRYELEWKDRVYVDVTYEGRGEGRRVRVECVNHSDLPQNLDVHLAATLTCNPLRPASVVLPDSALWIGALDYDTIHFARAPHRGEQATDAQRPGAWLQPGTVGGETLGGRAFDAPGDRADYTVELEAAVDDAVLLLRFHRWNGVPCRLHLDGFGQQAELDLGCDGAPMSQHEIALGSLTAGPHRFSVESVAGGELIIEGFALMPRAAASGFAVVSEETPAGPDVHRQEHGVELTYDGLPHRYTLEGPDDLPLRVRRVTGDDVPAIVCRCANDSVRDEWEGPGDRETVLLGCGPIALEAGTSRTLTFRVGLAGTAIETVPPFEGHFDHAAPFAFGMERLAATTLANVVFPTRHGKQYVRHYSPGRWWDCLYTWDSGMLGLALTALDLERAKDCLNQYLVRGNNPHAAFVEHGTPLPIQAELAMQIWKRTEDRQWLSEVFPGLRNFYEWLAGRSHGSITDRFQSGLLQTWDYNYNSGGWDDYPPQHALAQDPERRRRIAPCVTTSYAIRFARHMCSWAEALELDVSVYASDAERWLQALEIAWDDEAGHYSYVEHDEAGAVVGFYRHESGENYNRGFDGVIPLIAGGLPETRRQQLIDLFFDPKELWTPWGGTTVSQSAAYYSDAGYWNGAVWMPHNVMIWRALQEQGETDKARLLAETLLNTWEREARASYHSFELFRADTGRGAGWHQFSGLSASLLMLYREEFVSPA
jgi:hypothetical protein